jgi:hypothetical protein
LHGGEEQSDENGDDGDDDEEFDEGEASLSWGWWACAIRLLASMTAAVNPR